MHAELRPPRLFGQQPPFGTRAGLSPQATFPQPGLADAFAPGVALGGVSGGPALGGTGAEPADPADPYGTPDDYDTAEAYAPADGYDTADDYGPAGGYDTADPYGPAERLSVFGLAGDGYDAGDEYRPPDDYDPPGHDSPLSLIVNSGGPPGQFGSPPSPAPSSGLPHSGPSDSGPSDSGPSDSGPSDSGPSDSGSPEPGAADAGPAELGTATLGPAAWPGPTAGDTSLPQDTSPLQDTWTPQDTWPAQNTAPGAGQDSFASRSSAPPPPQPQPPAPPQPHPLPRPHPQPEPGPPFQPRPEPQPQPRPQPEPEPQPGPLPPPSPPRTVTADSLTADLLLPGRHKAPPGGWRRAIFEATGGLVRAPESAAQRRCRDLTARARTPVTGGHHRVAVVSLKGGVGKTTTTVGLGATLASLRGDRVIAVDANPDRGTLSDKLRLETSATVRDLLNERDQIQRYADVRAYTTQAASRLEVLASDRDPTVSVAFSEQDYGGVSQVLEHYYSICITDCGTGLLHSAMTGVLRLADQIVLVSSPSVDGARSASATLDWLQAHGHGDLVRHAVVVLSVIRPRRKSAVDTERLEQHFAARCRAVVRVPYDPHLDEGAEVELGRLNPATADAYLMLAAEIGDGFARPPKAARR